MIISQEESQKERLRKVLMSDEDVRPSAVMIPLVYEKGELKMLLTQRSGTISFGGQISFPGGKQEIHHGIPESPEMTALREVLEEMNIDPRKVSLVGNLNVKIAHFNKDARVSSTFHLVNTHQGIQRITTADKNLKVYAIHPVIAQLKPSVLDDIKLNHHEISRVIKVPVAPLLDAARKFRSGEAGMISQVERDGILQYRFDIPDPDHPGQTFEVRHIAAGILLEFLDKFKDLKTLSHALVNAPLHPIDKDPAIKNNIVKAHQTTAYTNDKEAAAWVEKTLVKGDEIRAKLRRQGRYIKGEYEQVHREASDFLEKLDAETAAFNFASILRTRALDKRTANKPYFAMESPEATELYTYAQADKEASKARRMLEAHGLGNGARITLRCVCPEHIFARNAILGAGGIVSPLSVRYNDLDFVSRMQLVGTDAIITTPDLLDQTLRLRDRLPVLPKVFVIERDPETGCKLEGEKKAELLKTLSQHKEVYPYLTSLTQYADTPVPIVKTRPGQTAFSMMTSGTSGVLKEVQIPHSYGLSSYIRSNTWWGVNGEATRPELNSSVVNGKPTVDKICCTALPGWMYFYRGLTACEMAGAQFVMARTKNNRLDIGFLDKVLRNNGITILASVPSLFRDLASYRLKLDKEGNGGNKKRGPFPYPDLRRAISTGEPLNMQTASDFIRASNGIPIANCYAATEEGPLVGHPEGMTLTPGSVGIPLPSVNFILVNEKGDPVPISRQEDRITRFAVKKTPISSRYRHASGQPDQVFINPTTGQQFRMLEDDMLIGHDPHEIDMMARVDDLIKRKAIQIFPVEIEKEFAAVFPSRKVNCTIGIPDPAKTNIVVSYIEIPREEFEKMGPETVRVLTTRALDAITDEKRPDFVFVAPVSFTRDATKDPYKDLRVKFSEILKDMESSEKYKSMRGGIVLLRDMENPIETLPATSIERLLSTGEVLHTRTMEADRHYGMGHESMFL